MAKLCFVERSVCRLLIISHALGISISFQPCLSRHNSHLVSRTTHLNYLRVWVEEADEGFVDQDENLEQGEVCHKAVKAWASGVDSPDHRFLCAGALVERSNHVSDAWTADAIMDHGGPNLQMQGAMQVLDNLFLCHLQRYANPIEALKNFMVQCGELESEYSCASHMAALARGFAPLRLCQQYEMYKDLDNDNEYLDSMVFDFKVGRIRYQQAAMLDNEISFIAQHILHLLPCPDEMIQHLWERSEDDALYD